jgi:putative ABC transport system permease protein
MSIPLIYNLRSVRARWTQTIIAVLGIAGTVGVFVAMLSLARGFHSALVSSGSEDDAIVLRDGSTSEMSSSLDVNTINTLANAPEVARVDSRPLVTQEVVVVATLPARSTGTDANVQVRGVSANVFDIRTNTKITAGRMFRPGLPELLVGKNASLTYSGLNLGDPVKFGGGLWLVVGIFDAQGSSFDSEIWCDANMLNTVYKRPTNIFQSATVRLSSPDAFEQFKQWVVSNPTLKVNVNRETDYYAGQAQVLTILITVLGSLIAAIMAIGAIFGALNTMYSIVADRSREIATIRALGFGGATVVFSFLIEALLIALTGGIIGCIAVLPLNGITTSTMNWQTFSRVAFAFRVTPDLAAIGIVFALTMGVLGGLPPAIRAARHPVAPTLRSL